MTSSLALTHGWLLGGGIVWVMLGVLLALYVCRESCRSKSPGSSGRDRGAGPGDIDDSLIWTIEAGGRDNLDDREKLLAMVDLPSGGEDNKWLQSGVVLFLRKVA